MTPPPACQISSRPQESHSGHILVQQKTAPPTALTQCNVLSIDLARVKESLKNLVVCAVVHFVTRYCLEGHRIPC